LEVCGRIHEVIFDKKGCFEGFLVRSCCCGEEIEFLGCQSELASQVITAWEKNILVGVNFGFAGGEDQNEEEETVEVLQLRYKSE
jgi:hypothetical protein